MDSNVIENYLEILQRLSPEDQRELISRLSSTSNGAEEKRQPPSINELYGSFISRKTADQIISEIKDRRVVHRKTETL